MITATTAPNDLAGYDPHAQSAGFVYVEEAAERAVDFFAEQLTHTKGRWAGEPFTLLDWQADVVRTLFGWRHRETNLRRYRQAFIFIPRKNGKTATAAGLALRTLLCDNEAEAECYCAAGDREQASLVFRTAAAMVRENRGVAPHVKIRESQRRMIYRDSFLRAIPANEGGAHGFNAHLVIGDELHVWAGREFYDALHTSTGARTQPLEIYITTAGWDKTTLCFELYERAKAVRDGIANDPTLLPVIYEADAEDDWTDEEVWAKANPSLGATISIEYLRSECSKAKENPALENTFRRLHLNQWTAQDSRWLPMRDWDACPVSEPKLERSELICGGLDLSQVRDLTAWLLVTQRGDVLKCVGHYYCPATRLEELERVHYLPLRQWHRDGWLTICDGPSIDYKSVIKRIVDDHERLQIASVGFDPYNADTVVNELENDHGLQMVVVRQGMASLSAPSKRLERAVIEHKLDASGDPVLRWMADNAAVKTDENGNIRPIKTVQKIRRQIDGVVALVMAISELDNAPPPAPRPYAERGGLYL